MRKLIAAINMTLDGFCDHTAIIADDEMHEHYSELISNAGALKSVEWETATLAKGGIEEEVLKLKQQAGKDILVGSPSLIVALTQLGLIDEYQLCVHPVIVGSGLPLFKNINDRILLKLLKTKTFGSGAGGNFSYMAALAVMLKDEIYC